MRNIRWRWGWQWWIAVACCVMLAVASCSHQKASQPARMFVVLFDVSGSTADTATRQRYFTDFSTVLDTLSPGDTLVADVITFNSQATGSYPIQLTIPRYNPLTTNKLLYDQQRQTMLADVRARTQTLLAQTPEQPYTDLFNAVALAEKAFMGYTGQRKIMIIFSDMIEQTSRYDFTGNPLTNTRIKDIIDEERTADDLPDLRNVDVWIVGAPGTAVSPDQINGIQRFWLAYFAACGANINKGRFVPRLLNIEG